MRKREPDDCLKCGRACPWDDKLVVPGKGVVHAACGALLAPRDYRSMSRVDQGRVFGVATRGLGRLVGMTPRDFRKAART